MVAAIGVSADFVQRWHCSRRPRATTVYLSIAMRWKSFSAGAARRDRPFRPIFYRSCLRTRGRRRSAEIRSRVVAFVATVVCAVAAASPGRARKRLPRPQSLRTLRSPFALSTLDAMWNARDAEHSRPRLTRRIHCLGFVDTGRPLENRASIRRHLAEQFATFPPELRHRIIVGRIRVVRPVLFCRLQGRNLRLCSARAPEPSVLKIFAIFAVLLTNEEGWKSACCAPRAAGDRRRACNR